MKWFLLIVPFLVFGMISCQHLNQHQSNAGVKTSKSKPSNYDQKLSFVAFGDFPYQSKDINLLNPMRQKIESFDPQFAVHIGDIKSGRTPCTNSRILRIKKWFNQFQMPVIYTPGDNEWTDCHRARRGPNDPLERLKFLRTQFFARSKSLGKKTINFDSLSEIHRFRKFKENVMWKKGHILFATIHVVGSNNNYQLKDPQSIEEFKQRELANRLWLNKLFAKAQLENAGAVVIFFHADPMFQLPDEDRDAFNGIISKLLYKSREFQRPTLLVHGDTHRLVMDQPFRSFSFGGATHNVSNFYRLEVYGSPKIGGVEVKVNLSHSNPFTFNPFLIKN